MCSNTYKDSYSNKSDTDEMFKASVVMVYEAIKWALAGTIEY